MKKTIAEPSVVPDALTDSLLCALAPVDLEPKRASPLRAQVLARVAQHEAATRRAHQFDQVGAVRNVRQADRLWIHHAKGVEKLLLHDDGTSQSWLARMQPGASLPAHSHDSDEESLVLEGSCYLGDTFLTAGDYQVALRGSHHGAIRSDEGCLLFVRTRALRSASFLAAPG